MKADLTRVTFDPLKQFSSVLMQQGRVQLDADWNEQSAILTHHLRRLAADLSSGQDTGRKDRAGPRNWRHHDRIIWRRSLEGGYR